jgi:hypothetical protein
MRSIAAASRTDAALAQRCFDLKRLSAGTAAAL